MRSSALAVPQQYLSFCHHAPSKTVLSCPSNSAPGVQRGDCQAYWGGGNEQKNADSFGVRVILKANLVSAARNRSWCAPGFFILWIKQRLTAVDEKGGETPVCLQMDWICKCRAEPAG